MTPFEIQEYIGASISAHFDDYTTESGELMTSEGGDGRFFGEVIATRYGRLAGGRDLFLAIGKTGGGIQIVKLGKSECLTPDQDGLDALLLKELGIAKGE